VPGGRPVDGSAERVAQFQAVAAALGQASTAAEVSELVINAAAAIAGPAAGAMYSVSADGQSLSLAAHVRLPLSEDTAVSALPLNGAERIPTPEAATVRSHRPLWYSTTADLAHDYPDRAAAWAAAGLQAAAILPVLLTDRPLGVCVFAFFQKQAFSADDRSLLLALAQQGVQAIERLRLYQAERDLRLHEQNARAEAEGSRQRLAFLVDTSSALSATLDYDALMQHAAHLVVPYLADYASMYILADDQAIHNVATAHISPAKQAKLQALHAQVQLRLDSPHSLIAHVMRTGTPLLDSDFDWQSQYAGAPPADRAYLEALQPNAHIVLPLVARGRALGVMVLATSEANRRLTLADLSLAEDVARRVALAADNARLLQQAQRLNAELEQRVHARTAELLQSETRFHILVDSIQDYAIFLLNPDGMVASWNTGAERIKGYRAAEIIGRHFSCFYTPEDVEQGLPARSLDAARQTGHFETEALRVRKDGSRFWANVVLTPVWGADGELTGYAKVTRDLTERKALVDELRASRTRLMQEIAARREVQQQLENAREAERARIAREVHDELGGALTGLKMGVRRLSRTEGLPPEASQQFDRLAAEIDDTVQVVRRIAHDLRPAVLDDFGLLAALEWQLSEFQKRSGLEIAWQSEIEQLTLSTEVAIACFRIFQEALTNIARHAHATRVEVEISQANGQLEIRIADNGVGLPAAGLAEHGHLGLVGMRERAALLGGELKLSGSPGQGTTVVLTVPVTGS
jgi:PAS domain S-box-containing protein